MPSAVKSVIPTLSRGRVAKESVLGCSHSRSFSKLECIHISSDHDLGKCDELYFMGLAAM